MLTFAGLLDEVQGNGPACAAMERIGTAMVRHSAEEQAAFWRAIELYYVSRKAPGAEPAVNEAPVADPISHD